MKVNDVWVTHAIDFQRNYEINNNIPQPGYWNLQDGDCGGGEGCQGPRSYEVEIPAEYFHKGDNKIILSMEHLTGTSLTWYRNVEFSLQYFNQSTSQWVLFWKNTSRCIYIFRWVQLRHMLEKLLVQLIQLPQKEAKDTMKFILISKSTNPSLNKPVQIQTRKMEFL